MSEDKKHDGLPVAGYVSQSERNVALANELKEAEERYLRILDRLANDPYSPHSAVPPDAYYTFDGRCLALARTKMQEANMWAVRAIFQPTRIKLPEDGQ